MVLEALRFTSRGDSATSRPGPLRNGSITSFFSPLSSVSTQAPPKAALDTAAVDSKLNTIRRLSRDNEVDRPSPAAVPAARPSTPPPTANSKKRKATTPRPATVAQTQANTTVQSRSARHSNGAPSTSRHTTRSSPSQAPAAKPDTSQNGAASTVKTSRETRTLRSKEKALFKSDLAMYFADYEAILMDTTPNDEREFLRVDEVIYLVDEPGSKNTSPVKAKGTSTLPARPRGPSLPLHLPPSTSASSSTAQQPAPVPTQNDAAKTIHLQSPKQEEQSEDFDPLGDDIYLTYHKRAERREKQLRNIEKERAQHEKAHLERLLEGLQGPDWLRVMGVNGVTEGEQGAWKPKRNYFIKEVSELVDKFRRWKDAERRLRLKKEREREAELEDSDEEDEDEEDAMSGASSSDLDARAAYQLLQEAGQTPVKATPRPRVRKSQHVLYEAPPSPEQPFTGFYKDAHLRAQALGEVRHGRHTTAFGVDLPWCPEEEEFELWEDLTTHDSRRARDRKRRKVKHEKVEKREFI